MTLLTDGGAGFQSDFIIFCGRYSAVTCRGADTSIIIVCDK